jgi:DNA-binding CsgD family transcriptional regulator
MSLLGRDAECQALDQLVKDAVDGTSRVVVLRGEAGIGKSALLSYVADRSERMRIARAEGVESEMELAYNGLHQLCAPMLDRLERLPQPQRNGLATVFGLSDGPPPDRFLVGLATLTLFAEVADHEPLVCIVDDAQWLDQASAQILGFVARRLLAERVAIVCAARTGVGDEVLAGLPELLVGGLGDRDALALLLESLHGPVDAAVSRRIVAESHGNPLALVEFPRTWGVAELAGGFGLPDGLPVTGRIEDSYRRRLHRLPSDTQLLVLAAAAEPVGDPVLLQRAAERLEIDLAAAEAAVDAGLLTIRGRTEFAHPLVRSCTYRSAAAHDRHRVHRALADATDAETDPDRRAWHRACAAPGPDEEVAEELERSAGRAQARGGIAAAAAFLKRAVELTAEPARLAERALTAAEVSFQAGWFDATLRLSATAEAAQPDPLQRARVDLVRGQLAFASGHASDAAQLMYQAATQLKPLDQERARQIYVAAWGAASVAGSLGGAEIRSEICRAARSLPPRLGTPAPIDLLLDGLTLLTIGGHTAATPVLQRAAKALVDIPLHDILRWGWMASAASNAVWDNDGAYAIARREVQLVRDAGAIANLPLYLSALAIARAWMGDFAGAASNVTEAETIAAATGGRAGPWASLRLRALRGREAETAAAITDALEQAAVGAQGIESYAHWAAAVLNNGLGRYEEAVASARHATSETSELWVRAWTLPELVEASVRLGDVELARDALERLSTTTAPCGTDFPLGIEARSRALVSVATAADELHREAIDRLGRTQVRTELARAHLLYGEWLRREGRRVDAREQLRRAYDFFVAIGMEAFAARARRELMATGEKVRKRSPDTRDELTPQEEQIARLARDGLSNPEIAAQLFISAKTVEWHLGHVFTKLSISSRRQLRTTLPEERPLVGRP